jgi:hypothetical protein
MVVAHNEDRSKEISMSSQRHSLDRQCKKLNQQIEAEIMNPVPDRRRLQELMRRKLRIKDEKHRLLWGQREGARFFKSGLLRPKQQ